VRRRKLLRLNDQPLMIPGKGLPLVREELPKTSDRMAHDLAEQIIKILPGIHSAGLAGLNQAKIKGSGPGSALTAREEPVFSPLIKGKPMAYGVIVRANEILDVLKTEIGASCERYDTEDSFLRGTLQFIERKIRDPESYLDFWNYLDEIDIDQFKKDLEDLKTFIVKVIKTPLSERGEPPFK
jgi:hypothetical protein